VDRFFTMICGFIPLLIIHIPPAPISEEGKAAKGTIWHEAAYGWLYIRTREGFFYLLLIYCCSNLCATYLSELIPPLVLSSNTVDVLGYILSFAGIGALIGSILVSCGISPNSNRIFWIVALLIAQGSLMLCATLPAKAWIISAVGFCMLIIDPFISACDVQIWHAKVPADIQGRVFAIRHMIVAAASPIGSATSGVLIDYVFEPMMTDTGYLASTVGAVIGTGKGRGISVLLILLGLFQIICTSLAYCNPRLRLLEKEIPDCVVEDKDKKE